MEISKNVDFGGDFQRIVAIMTAVLHGDEHTTAELAQEIAGDLGRVLHMVAFCATQIQALGEEAGLDIEDYLRKLGSQAATYNDRNPDGPTG